MSADLLSNFLGMTLQATGNNNNAWGTILNGSTLVSLERAIAGNIRSPPGPARPTARNRGQSR
jgi:hypothetical protein